MAFATGGKRSEDVSLRLKAQNLHKTREQTRQMALETRKMEERLEELKVAMSREKEQRERQGGGFWKTGQTGTLGNYGKEATEKRSKPKEKREKSTKARKYKVLKDEPVANTMCITGRPLSSRPQSSATAMTPERSKQPGTVAHIAQREAAPKDNKMKGPKCGQCETRQAQVTCLECGEDYCAADFASFHLKGALKRHRSIPVRVNGASARQNFVNPRPPVQQSSMDKHMTQANGYMAASPVGGATEENPMKVTLTDIDITDLMPSQGVVDHDTARSSPVGASHNFDGPSLLDGHYDEGDSAASFQAALKAWRAGGSEEAAATSGRRAVRPVSPVKSPIVQTDHGTSTMENDDRQPLEITFTNNTMSYADKLLLKRHRRTDLDPLPQDDYFVSTSPRTQPVRQSRQRFYADSDEELNGYDDDEDGVDFESLYNAMVPQGKQMSRPQSDVSIIELTELPSSMKGLEQSSSYRVTEEPGHVVPSKPRLAKSGRKKGAGSARQSLGSPTDSASKPSTPATRTSKSRSSQRISMDIDKENVKTNNKSVAERLGSRTPVSTRLTQAGTDLEKNTKNMQSENQENHARDLGASSRADSRARSRMNRPSSSMAERRKVDRSKRQATKEAAMDGNLTKAPSEGLKEVLQRASSIEPVEYQGGLGDFFTVGVKPAQEDRVLTPSSNKKNKKDEKWKVSYKLYQMAPRSWRPDSSLGDTIALDEVSVVNSGLVQSEEQAMQTISWSWSSHATPTPDSTPLHKLPPLCLSSRPPTAGKSSRRSKTPTTASRRSVTPRIPSTLGHSPRPPTASGRESRAIVMDGEDLSCHDNDGEGKCQDDDDDETLDQLEWELASQSGRITADGKISRMSMISPELSDDDRMTDTELRRSYNKGLQAQGFDINSRLRESELMVDFEEMEQQMIKDEVKALR